MIAGVDDERPAMMNMRPGSAQERHLHRKGLSPYAILSSIHSHQYARFRTCREWFLSIDTARRGYVLHDDLIASLDRIGTHPQVARSAQLRQLLQRFPSRVAGRFDYDEFCRFISQYIGTLQPSAGAHSPPPCEQQEAAAVAAVRFDLLGRVRSLREAFLLVDDGRHGGLGFEEFRRRLVEVGVHPSAVESTGFRDALAGLKTDIAGYLQFNDFLQLLQGQQEASPVGSA